MKVKVTAPVRIDISGGWPDSDPYRKDYGGVVLNAAINLRVSACFDGFAIHTSSENVPPKSGLGTSGALRAAYIVASNTSLIKNKIDLIQRVYEFENRIIGHRAGKQDEAAAIYGGVNFWEFGANESIKYTPISKRRARHLEERLALVYTGQTHLSANMHNLVFGPGNYEKNISRLDRMKEIAWEMKDNLTDENVMARLINETWDLQRLLHPSIETGRMRRLDRILKRYYLARRGLGAAGGGSMIYYTNDPDKLIAELMKEKIPDVKVIPFKFDWEGIKIYRRISA
jgi:D-glycero-alpha-D-manno-heptose-7-phosphate kinase